MIETHRNATRIAGPDVCRSVLLVGESNPYGSDPRYALYCEPENSAGGRLQRLIFGIEARRWYLPMWRTNLCVGAWDGREARTRAGELLTPDAPWSVVVMFGRKVEKAFRVDRKSPETPAFRSINHALLEEETAIRRVARDVGTSILGFLKRPAAAAGSLDYFAARAANPGMLRIFHLLSLPHPSGRCTEWNVPGHIARTRELMARLVPNVPWGELGHESGEVIR